MDAENTGWASRLMAILRFPAQLVGLNLLIVLGTVVGGVVLGLFPALRAGAALLDALRRGTPSESLVRTFVAHYREDFWRSNLLGVPFWILGALAVVDLQVFRVAAEAGDAFGSALLLPFVVVVTIAGVALIYLAALGTRVREGVWATWRFVFVAPFAWLGTTVGVVLVLGAFLVGTWQLPWLVPLLGFSGPLFLALTLVGPRLDATLEPADEPALDTH